MPRRCANCRAYLALVGVEVLKRVQGPVKPKEIPEAKEPTIQIQPQTQPQPQTQSQPIPMPKPRPKPKRIQEFKLESQPAMLEVKAEWFECGKCGAKIEKGMKQCPVCGVELNWGQIYE